MNNFSLTQLLKALNSEEFDKLNDFICSPYFNKAVYIRNYFDKVKEFYPGFENFENSKEKIFSLLYPGREYNDATIRKLNSELLKLIEEFITINSLREKIHLKNNFLLKELDKRKLDNLFLKKMGSSYELLEKTDSKNEEYFKELHDLNNIEIFFNSLRDGKREISKYHQSIDNLDKFYIIQKLKRITILARVDKMYAKVISDKKEIINFINAVKKSKYFELPVVQIVFNILLINRTDEEEYFNNLKKIIPLYKAEISRDELETAYIAMLNFCVAQANMGNTKFTSDELQIYKFMIEDNFLLTDNRLQASFYKNIVFCSVEAGDLKFAEEFKEEYAKYLFIPEKNNLVEFCNANIAYAKKDYAAALETMAKINFTLIYQRLSLRGLYMKIFYENEMYEQGFLNIDSYKQMLKREKTLPADVLKLYTNFISLYSKLLKIKVSPDKGEAKMLLNQIKKADTVVKSWLIAQCELLC